MAGYQVEPTEEGDWHLIHYNHVSMGGDMSTMTRNECWMVCFGQVDTLLSPNEHHTTFREGLLTCQQAQCEQQASPTNNNKFFYESMVAPPTT